MKYNWQEWKQQREGFSLYDPENDDPADNPDYHPGEDPEAYPDDMDQRFSIGRAPYGDPFDRAKHAIANHRWINDPKYRQASKEYKPKPTRKIPWSKPKPQPKPEPVVKAKAKGPSVDDMLAAYRRAFPEAS